VFGYRVKGNFSSDTIFHGFKVGGRTYTPDWDSGIRWWNSLVLPVQLIADVDGNFKFRPNGSRTGSPPEPATDWEFSAECRNQQCDVVVSADHRSDGIGWSWTEPGDHEFRVRIEKDNGSGGRTLLCEETRQFHVERSTDDPDRQAVDYWAPGSLLESDSATIHAGWHSARDRQRIFMGEDWLVFHRFLVARFDDWRAIFGYQPVEPYDGASAIPAREGAFTMADLTRPATNDGTFHPNCYGNGSGCPPRPWFTAAGDGQSARGNDLGSSECHYATDLDFDGPDVVPTGQMKLGDFRDARGLGCVINKTHHALMHASVPGAFELIATTPYDPLFWSYHKWASGVGNYGVPALRTARAASTTPDGVLTEWERTKAVGPPGVTAAFPPRGAAVARLPGVLVFFWEPVTGVAARDLVVNGSAATAVGGSGAGPYVFSGFAAPPLGPVSVTLGPGMIRDADDNPLAPETWDHAIAADGDGDDIIDEQDNCPTVSNQDQRNTDAVQLATFADHDAADAFADTLGDACDDDDDGDGILDAVEIAQGSDPRNWRDPDPCPLDPGKIEPGECGCGSRELARTDGGIDCVFASAVSCAAPPLVQDHPHAGSRAATVPVCEDDDPCTTNGCVEGRGCVNEPLGGMEAASCVCRRAAPVDCAGRTLPKRVVKPATKACTLLTQAARPGLRTKKVGKLVKKGAAQWKAALKAIRKRSSAKQLGDTCAAALTASYEDARRRATAAAPSARQ